MKTFVKIFDLPKVFKMKYNFDLLKVNKMTHNRDLPKVSKIYNFFFLVHSINMLNPSLKDLNPSSEELKEIAKLLAKKGGIKGYKSMSKDALKCS